ncbi:MAG: protein-L-isoaspartate(D-aspartate) O-methyltransferase [Pirellulales bacterium]|nr:protein-L-isoaspartate(D-aspartate) O-methyltransferase [Pirellulales bacterium]
MQGNDLTRFVSSHRRTFVLVILITGIAGYLAFVAIHNNHGQSFDKDPGNLNGSRTYGIQQDRDGDDPKTSSGVATEPRPANHTDRVGFQQERKQMVDRQLAARDIRSERVLATMRKVPRHLFVPNEYQAMAYSDRPLPIGHDQTISQPYIVALMTQLVQPKSDDRALDVGTGSGYQAAILAELVKEVYSIEILEPLAKEAGQRLKELGYKNIQVRHGDGYRGWPDRAPFDVIIVAAAPDHIPQPLVDQLAPGGRLVIPVGNYFWQDLLVLEKDVKGKIHQRKVTPVAFVPMTGEAQQPKKRD